MNDLKLFTYLGLLLFGLPLQAQQASITSTEALSPRIANYEIKAKLNHVDRTIKGIEKLNWRNTSQDVITELQFHMYLNAFKNNQSTFMTEGGSSSQMTIIKKTKRSSASNCKSHYCQEKKLT